MKYEEEYLETKKQALSLLEKALREDPNNWKYEQKVLYYKKGGIKIFHIEHNQSYQYYSGEHLLGIDIESVDEVKDRPNLQKLYLNVIAKIEENKKINILQDKIADLKGNLYVIGMDI